MTFISDIYIWHLCLTFISNIAPYLWHLYLIIQFSRYVQFTTWNMYWSKLIEDLCEKCSTHKVFGNEFQKTRTKLAAYEGDWRLPSSPIVEKNMCISLCKFFITWNMYWIHFSRYVQFITWNMYWSKLIEDLCEKNSTHKVFGNEFQKTRTKLAASEGTWRLPSSPIVEKKCAFPYVNSL